MDCPEPAQIAELVNGDVASLDAAALEGHLYTCARCEEVVAALVSSSWASSLGSVAPTPAAGGASTQVDGGAPPAITVPMLRPVAGIIPAGTRLGRYRVRRWLGRGGMGEVYEGYDPELDRRVALKVLRTHGRRDETAQRRLGREAKTLARLSSPYVVAALDVGTFADQLFLVMELVEGPTLSTWLLTEPRTWRDILDKFLAAGEGIAAAHEVGVIHRDFKPQNVLIGTDGKPRVSDFGLARGEGDANVTTTTDAGGGGGVASADTDDHVTLTDLEYGPLTQTGMVIGTPRYMAPEQFLRRPLDARVDQFSFCVALYEALYGVHPFTGRPQSSGGIPDPDPTPRLRSPRIRPLEAESHESLRMAVLAGRVSRAPRRGKAPHSLARVLQRGLARNPADRFPSLRDLLTALKRTAGSRTRRVGLIAGVALVATAGIVAAVATHRSTPTVLLPTGEPADWSNARVVARVPDFIHCVHKVNDGVVRIVWGLPRRAEDIDVRTGVRTPSPLVPESYRHGCPTTSPDGRSVVFEGYDHRDRPHIFHSTEPNGANAEPIVSSAEPSLNSEPLWLSSGRAFVYDVDVFHPGLFSLQTNGSAVVPDRDRSGFSELGFFKAVSGTGERVAIFEGIATVGWIHLYRGPHLRPEGTLTISGDLGGGSAWRFGANPETLYGTLRDASANRSLLRTDPSSRLVWVATVRGRDIEDFEPIDASTVVITTSHQEWDIEFRDHAGSRRRVPREPNAIFRTPSATPDGDILFIEETGDARSRVRRYRPRDGSFTEVSSESEYLIESLPNGDWLTASLGPVNAGIAVRRCGPDGAGNRRCKTLFVDSVRLGLFADPSGKVVAFPSMSAGGLIIKIAPTDGGTPTVLVTGTSGCQPVWSGPTTLWYSRRAGGSFQWVEIDVVTREPTGRTRTARGPCLDQKHDPDPPVTRDVRSVVTEDWDVRVHELP